MSHENLFACVPQIRPYQIIPSEDDPKEYILLLEENGASLGINHTERRLIELFDGKLAVGDIVLRVMNDSSAKVTDIRRLLWDLDRFGFLETSPWDEQDLAEAWGYWGMKKQPVARFYYSSIVGGLERSIVRFGMQPVVLLILFVVLTSVFVGSFFIHTDETPAIWSQTSFLMVNQSVALGVLVVVFGIHAALFISAWAAASVIRAVHDSPVGLAVFWQSPFIRLMLDGRALRLLPLVKAIQAALIPPLKLYGVASFLSLLAALNEGVRREWLLHLSLAFAITAFGILIPWFSTILSRDILLRLRGDSVFWIAWRAVRKAFQSLFQSTKETVLHEQLFLWWGVWSILSLVLLLRFSTSLFRADFPILYSHFLQENHAVILWVFIVVSSVLVIGIAGAVITFVGWLLRELYNEIRLRAFPQYDMTLAIVSPLLFLILAALCISSGYHRSQMFLDCCTGMIGLCVVGFGIKKWMKEPKGLYVVLHSSVAVTGCILLLTVLDRWVFQSILQQYWIMQLSIFVMLAVLLFPTFSFRHVLAQENLQNKYLYPLIFIWVAVMSYHRTIQDQHVSVSIAGMDIRYGLLGIEVLWFVLMMYPISLIKFVILPMVAFFPFYMEGLQTNPPGDVYLVTLLFIPGAVFSGYIFVHGCMMRIEQSFVSSQNQSNSQETQDKPEAHKTIHPILISVMEKLFQCPVQPTLQTMYSEDDLREMLLKLNRSLGPSIMRLLFRCAAHQLTWQQTQKMASLMPPSVALPKLSNWDAEKVVSYLRNVPTFMHAGDEINQISAVSHFRFYRKDDRIITQDANESDLHILVLGKAAVEVEHTFGNTRIAVMSVGDFVGEIGFLSGSARTATVRALEPVMVISVSREAIDESMPLTLQNIREAEAGQSWLQALHEFTVFREFPPGLLSRVSLESQHAHLEVSRTLVLHQEPFKQCVAVLLSGEAVFQQDGENVHLQKGKIAGIVETMLNEPVQGIIRAERQSHILLVNQELFRSALIELLTPKQMLLTPSNPE